MTSSPRLRAAKPPFYKNVFVRHPVSPLWPLGRTKRDWLRRLQPLVVMGRGHSGTRIVAWICHHLGFEMGADPNAVPSGDPAELSFKHHQRIVATHSLDVRAASEVRWRDLNRFQKAVHGFYRRLGSEPERWGWKFPETYLIGPYVEATFPNARYLHLLRDGRDVAFKRHLTDVSEHRLARAILRRQGAMTLPHHLQAAASWALQVERFAAFRRTIPDSRVLEMRYETLVREPLAATEEIAAFLGVPVSAAAHTYATDEISAAHVASFRLQDAARVRDVERQVGAALVRQGYELTQTAEDGVVP